MVKFECCFSFYRKELVTFSPRSYASLRTFKTNKYLNRAIMLGNIAASNDMIFEYLNMDVIPVTSNKYATSFGFTENEILSAWKEYDLEQEKESI